MLIQFHYSIQRQF